MTTSTAPLTLFVGGVNINYQIETQEPLEKKGRRLYRAVCSVSYRGELRPVEAEFCQSRDKAMRALYDLLILRHEKALAQIKADRDKLERWNKAAVGGDK